MTLPPVGTAAGAVYVVGALLAVEVGLNVPQVFAGVQLQLTPLFAESLETTAVMGVVPPIARAVGGVGLNATEIGPGGVEEPPPHPLSAIAETTSKRANLPFMCRHLKRRASRFEPYSDSSWHNT